MKYETSAKRKMPFDLKGKWLKYGRWGLFGFTVASYPIGTLILNGPLLKYYFPWRQKFIDIPAHLKPVVESQYQIWLERENRLPKDAVHNFFCSSSEEMDSVGYGSMGVRFGTRIALPFYARFRNLDEIIQYCKCNLQPLNFLNHSVCVIWDSEFGDELAKTFLLSEEELKFLIIRDLYTYDGYSAYITRALSWTTFTTFSSLFTYWAHRRPIFHQSFLSFLVLYIFFLFLSWLGSVEWYKLYRFMADLHADTNAAEISAEHCRGGNGYYWKMLKRNRMLREKVPNGTIKVKPSGDLRSITTSLLTRFNHLRDVMGENEEIETTLHGDD